ncbi:MAG: molybdopterin-guanine dinucleotide biosynthesis protein MobB [Woeseiaceae bacterium]
MSLKISCPLLGFSAYSGTGKTTLLSQVLPLLKSKGIRVAVIKHAHHSFDVDHVGKDSHTLRHAGASQMLIASSKRWALMVETPDNTEDPKLPELIEQLDHSQLDIILVEGFKNEPFPKIELYRSSLDKPFLHSQDKNIIAIASDETIQADRNIHRLDLNNIQQITDYILYYMQFDEVKVSQLK